MQKFTTTSVDYHTVNLLCNSLNTAQQDYLVYGRQKKAATTCDKVKEAQRILQPEANQEAVESEYEVAKEVFMENINQKFINTDIMRFKAKK